MRRTLALAAAPLLAVFPALPAAASAADGTAQDEDVPAGLSYPRGGEGPEGSEILFYFQDPRIAESSGLAPSARHEGIWWTHNDSGDFAPEVYAVNEAGETVATIALATELRDWEAISLGVDEAGEPAVFVGDIGDNFGGGWPDIRVHRFPEPRDLVDQTMDVTTFTFVYEDGGRDAEGMMIDPRDNRLYIVSKEFAGSVYAAPPTLDPAGTNTLTRIDSAPLFATDAAFHPDGSQYAIRTYWGVTFYDAADGVPGRSTGGFELPEMEQGESLAYTPDGTALLAGSEGPHSPVWRVPLDVPEAMEPPGGDDLAEPDTGADGHRDPGERSEAGSAVPFLLSGAAVAALLIAGIVWLARRS